jgi:rRNA pseudouridine-1189 N-methylase Emg1 (Nep1/Mra1 family)
MGSLSKTKKINKMEPIPHNWEDIQPDIIYQTLTGMLVSFSKKKIRLCQR